MSYAVSVRVCLIMNHGTIYRVARAAIDSVFIALVLRMDHGTISNGQIA